MFYKYIYAYRVLPAGGKGQVNVTCDEVIPTNPPSTNKEATSGVISSQTTYVIAQSTTPVIIENNSNKTSKEPSRGTSAEENYNLMVMTPSEPGGMQNIGKVSTTNSRRSSSTKTGIYLQLCQKIKFSFTS